MKYRKRTGIKTEESSKNRRKPGTAAGTKAGGPHSRKMSHTFVICAYGESPYLEECILSLRAQTIKSHIRIATSTPNEGIIALSEKYGLPLCINKEKKGLAGDWNFALDCADTPLVTLAHQDDRYYPDYIENILKALRRCRHPLIVFTDYNELRGDRSVAENRLLKIKRLMLWPLQFSVLQENRWIRRRILSFGNPICCPAVTYVKPNLKNFVFKNNMKSNIDWQAWEEISRRRGSFVYVPKSCMEHRIHQESTTSGLIGEGGRRREDVQVLQKFWPRWAAGLIEHFYSRAEKSNGPGQDERHAG